ncbi:HET-domain-containing protein, partial [Macroventuria anomochaeta]
PYTSIDSEKGDIRLLELQPGRFQDVLDIRLVASNLLHGAEQAYEALSYVWGTSICPQKAILNGIPVTITENLDCALRHLRLKLTTRTLWIDALSMNQADIQERNHQVQIMGKIYSTAVGVIVWLGPVNEKDLHLKAASIETPRSVPSEAIHRLIARPWFCRAWVVQELALSK